ncbi:dorsal-ventral patterning tolloid-like protein 1 isoform X3 [Pomacea canaliculata]|uniref:dorsal-ventral patterning tolloid-like protein 1 isoform X3 n=1 Tax=Pomacea canaliculata TaxID=400727 RepID=UPI000D72E333|nr:dorsal-ventral patterning tolloid-like protein 1 isoform X3 [Pomacea canaliculata]
MWRHAQQSLALWLWTAAVAFGILSEKDCDVTIAAANGAPINATFTSPEYPSFYPNNVHCIYKFIGHEDQRVRIRFNSFALQGRYPTCDNDYVDVFAELQKESDDLLDARLTGRFCDEGKDNLPRLIVSTNHVLILSFFTNAAKTNKGFEGTYQFLDDNIYQIGTEAPPKLCGFNIRSESKLTGYIVSPTYPGMYPDNQYCYYKLQGKPGMRIRLVFEEFVLFHGGEYCPFDFVKIYDGYTKEAPVIGTFCGNYNSSTVLYSTAEALHVEFVTGQGRVLFGKPVMDQEADFKFERKGFNITYEFSDQFVDLGFITVEASHILGTLCDQRIMSRKESNGSIFSPKYPKPFPEGIVCHYYLDGMMDHQNLEKVRVTFTDFSIPGNMPYCAIGYIGQLRDRLSDRGDVEEKFCGIIRPPTLLSNGPRMILALNTHGAMRGGHFVAHYKFITDYDIEGKPIVDGECKFLYESSKMKTGEFNSPRHPARYPNNTDCEYILVPLQGEVLIINFEVFILPDSQSGDPDCTRADYVAIYEAIGRRNNYTLTEKYCDKDVFPSPYATSNEVKVIFHSNEVESSVGFKATYSFVPTSELQDRCRANQISGQGTGDVITSPLYPRKYRALTVCEWTIRASRSFNKILVELPDLNMEGFSNHCQHAVLKIYDDRTAYKPMASLCGKKVDGSFMSAFDSLTLRFITSPASLGASGFQLSWTEIHTQENCLGFECSKNKYCIAESLKCNKQPNCGTGDTSDESAECMYGPKSGGFQILHIAIGTSISSFFCIILLICGFYHRRKFRTERAPPDHDHVEVRYVSAPTGCNTTDRLLMEERADQNNARVTDSPRCQKVSMENGHHHYTQHFLLDA